MKGKVILVLEDNKFLGQNITEGFQDRGFDAYHATSPSEAFAHLEKLGRAPDVVVLDMNLKANQTGADVGRKILERYREEAPEFIVYSAYDDRHYYRAAFDLGAGIYIHKADEDYRLVITNARVLAIRRAIRNCSREIRGVVSACKTVGEAMKHGINELLIPQLQACMGTSHFVLFSEQGENRSLVGSDDSLTSHPVWNKLQEKAFQCGRPIFDVDRLDAQLIWPDVNQEQSLTAAVVVPLYHKNGFKASLVIKDGSDKPGSMEERAQPLAEALVRFFRAALVENFFTTIHVMAESEMGKREQLQSSARFCCFVSKMQEELGAQAVQANEVRPGALILSQLKTLSRELWLMGTQMETMGAEKNELKLLSLNELVKTEWLDLVEHHRAPEGMLDPYSLGNWQVLGNRASLGLAIRRILTWMANREQKYPEKMKPRIKIQQNPLEAGLCSVVFRDHSPRLPEPMLCDLFKPFSTSGNQMEEQLGLFQAKMLVEVSNDGKLWERPPSQPPGHVLEMQLHTP